MTDPVRAMADRARREPFFLGHLLERFARAERMDDAALAAALGCAPEALTDLRLCGAPRPDRLADDVRQVADGLGLDAGRLLAVVKRAAVIARLQDASSADGRPTLLMAARERDA